MSTVYSCEFNERVSRNTYALLQKVIVSIFMDIARTESMLENSCLFMKIFKGIYTYMYMYIYEYIYVCVWYASNLNILHSIHKKNLYMICYLQFSLVNDITSLKDQLLQGTVILIFCLLLKRCFFISKARHLFFSKQCQFQVSNSTDDSRCRSWLGCIKLYANYI